MVTFIAPLPSAFNHEAKNLASQFRYWRQCFIDFCDKGLFKTDEEIKAIKESLAPTNVSEVRSFLGLVTFYSKFVPNLATMAAPIYQLTRKNVPFDWNEECQKAFQSLKQELISNRFLTYFNPKLPLIVSCDASPVGLGAVLAHKLPSGEEKPIAYASRTLSNSERNYSQINKESLASISLFPLRER